MQGATFGNTYDSVIEAITHWGRVLTRHLVLEKRTDLHSAVDHFFSRATIHKPVHLGRLKEIFNECKVLADSLPKSSPEYPCYSWKIEWREPKSPNDMPRLLLQADGIIPFNFIRVHLTCDDEMIYADVFEGE